MLTDRFGSSSRRRWVRFILPAVVAAALPLYTVLAGDTQFVADRPVDLVHLRLDLDVDLVGESVSGRATVDLKALRDVTAIRFDAVDFAVSGVTVARGSKAPGPATYTNDGKTIEVSPGKSVLKRGEAATVRIRYVITRPKKGLHFVHPSQAEPDIHHTLWSQGEAIFTRYWIPCFDHPNEMQTTEMVVTVPPGNEAISNGRLVSRKENPNGTLTFHWLQDKPHTIYLVSLVVGKFHVERQSWRGRPVTYYVPPRCREYVKNTFGNTTRMLDFFSDRIGVEYPWDKYAQVCAEHFGGGMENTSATTLETGILHDDRAHVDTRADELVSHELAHQWFGDLVTCANWSHLWLNEGYATYLETVWDGFDLGPDAFALRMHDMARIALVAGKKWPILDRTYRSPGEMFDGRAYPKGAWVLHMLRHRVGDDGFWRSTRRYLIDNKHQPVETSDFRKAFEAETGRSLERFFYDWVERAGHPELAVRYEWDEGKSTAYLRVEQTQKADPFEFPLELEFRVPGQEPLSFTRMVRDRKHRFSFPLPGLPDRVRVDPNNVVLKKITEDKPRELWAKQLTDDPNPVGRIRAVEYFADLKSKTDQRLLVEALQREPFWGVAVEIVKALGGSLKPISRDALLAALSHEDARVRRVAAGELGNFKNDKTVTAALRKRIVEGDASYRVEATAISSYIEHAEDGMTEFLLPLLDRDSHDEVIRRAVLRGLGKQKDPSVLDTLLEWTQRGRPNECRRTALQAAVNLKRDTELSDARVERLVKAASACLKGVEVRRTLSTAISVLGDLGEAAAAAKPALQVIAKQHRDDRIRRAAKQALELITGKRLDADRLHDDKNLSFDRLESRSH